MKQSNFPQGTSVKVTWHDAHTLQGWQPIGGNVGVARATSYGIILNTDKDGITLASTVAASDDGDTGALAPFTVPAGMILSIEEVSPVATKTKKTTKKVATKRTTKKSTY